SGDTTIRLWDVETSKSLYGFNGHRDTVRCVDISPLQSSSNNKSNSVGVIGGNGYTICSGSRDKTIRIWDIETSKPSIILNGHENWIMSVKYGSNKLVNTILSGSSDQSVRLWDIRSGQQTQVFNGHKNCVKAVEYSPFVVKSNSGVSDSSNVICSGSFDNTIRFWDVRLNKGELYAIKENYKGHVAIYCLKFVSLKGKESDNKNTKNSTFSSNLCYGSSDENESIFELKILFLKLEKRETRPSPEFLIIAINDQKKSTTKNMCACTREKGIVDFWSEATTILRVSDGMLIVVNCVQDIDCQYSNSIAIILNAKGFKENFFKKKEESVKKERCCN
ncbi:WD-40 repeat protein, partial [Reticulomyxa filosa]